MAIKIKSTKGLHKNGIKVLVYGKGGIGKTKLMGTAPKPLILSCEGGLLSLEEDEIDYLDISSVADIYEAYDFVKSKKGRKYETVCLDSISEVAEIVLSDYKKKEKDPRQAYGKMAEEMFLIVRMFRDLKNRNVVFSAKRISLDDADTGLTQYVPSIPGRQVTNFLPYQFDLVMYMTLYENENGKRQRVLMTEASYEHDSKDRSGKLNRMERPNLAKIFRKISGKKKKVK